MKENKTNESQKVLYVTMYADNTSEQTIKCFNLPLTVNTEINPADGRVWVEFKQLDAKKDWKILAVFPACPSVVPVNLVSLLKSHEIEKKVSENILSWITDYLKDGVFHADDNNYNTFHLPAVARKVEHFLEKLYVHLDKEGQLPQ